MAPDDEDRRVRVVDELKEVLAQRIVSELESKESPALKHDSSTNTLIQRYRANKATSS